MDPNTDTEQFTCEQAFVLTTISYSLGNANDGIDTLHKMQLMVSFKISMCLLLLMYVLYSLCKIAFNTKQRDHLTTTIQILFGLTLLCNQYT